MQILKSYIVLFLTINFVCGNLLLSVNAADLDSPKPDLVQAPVEVVHAKSEQAINPLIDLNQNHILDDSEVIEALYLRNSKKTPEIIALSNADFEALLSLNDNAAKLKQVLTLMLTEILTANTKTMLHGVLLSREQKIYNLEFWNAIGQGYHIRDYKRLLAGIEDLDPDSSGTLTQDELDEFRRSGVGYPYSVLKHYTNQYTKGVADWW
ncbi:MAG: hypothetical protein O3C63_07625 [Cyanobacteria bacterium]|nr:hypothetical protein [Cyanobacteriota bacterium]MDA1021206.1 hypothetical protein [Cyanobacteriota bacterium]